MLSSLAAARMRNDTELMCSMKMMLLGELNPDPSARVIGFKAQRRLACGFFYKLEVRFRGAS